MADCFVGQLHDDAATRYRIDPGQWKKHQTKREGPEEGFKNADILLPELKVLENIQNVQRRQNLPQSSALVSNKISPFNLDIEMETGTGKTYCYIKTMFELNRRYGWNKFIIVVPSIAIREGVAKSLEITADHFQQDANYGKKARTFIYNSKSLHELETFSSDAGINVMVINVQAFNATGKDNRRIYEELDDFQSRRPIDVIAANRPILILDEPQKMEGAKTKKSLEQFKALMVLRYSATHKTDHNKIHRLDALDAYNQKLVKKIEVRGISVKGLTGTNAYLYLESIEISSSKPPMARIEIEVKEKSGIKRRVRKLGKGDNLFDKSEGLNQYDGFVIADVNANTDVVSFTNGHELYVGEATGDVNEETLRRIQIREAIKAHFDKERALFNQGIKVLTLFFIDEVAKYRDYDQPDTKGEYARIFEEEYNLYLNEVLQLDPCPYFDHLHKISAEQTHKGYFSIDKKGMMVDAVKSAKSEKVESTDTDAYDLILKEKERLLSFQEPTRFIFSHSALREGWDNPNVFVICTLKHSDNIISRRQEVGRGLRICVNQDGERMDNPLTVHSTNVLTVVASESYKYFVTALQKDISASLSARPRVADTDYFTGKQLITPDGAIEVTPQMAKQIYKYLLKNDYVTDEDHIAEEYHQAKKEGSLVKLPDDLKPYEDQIFQLVDSVFSEDLMPGMEDGRKKKTNPLNDNFEKKEFLELWDRINRKAVYSVQFDSAELVKKCIATLDEHLRVTPMQYTIQSGEQVAGVGYDEMKSGDGFKLEKTETETHKASVHSRVKYDLLGKLAEECQLKRQTIAKILKDINKPVFAQFKTNPENFISEAARLINEQKATEVIEHLAYDTVEERFELDIFTNNQTGQDFSKAGDKLKKHVYDYVVTDSKVEREFVKELDTSTDVVVYTKLPNGFFIPTPVGTYNPDWAIAFVEGSVKHVFFVAETKGDMSTMQLKEIEKTKIKCAKKFFEKLNEQFAPKNVRYDVIKDFDTLMNIVH
ncbi:MAG: type III restriction-modification system endonuclease [Endozoicomonas sp.]|uniref:type III restriction-modification system endonuclease n=1 Tax=Endozoicomonas sp. TaxID=1892382 RepID=UPI003D9B8879